MAKKKANRSNAIRDYFEQNPQASAKAVVEALAAEGMKVTAALVYKIKGRMTQIKVHKKQKA